MKVAAVLFLTMVSLFVAKAGKLVIVESWDNGNPKITKEYFSEDNPESFIFRSYYETETLELVVEIRNSQRQGEAIYFYPTGQLKYKCVFKNDVLDGPMTFWYPTGALWQEIHYSEGIVSDSLKEYYPTGDLKMSGVFQNGTGNVSYYYRNRSVQMTGMVLNGKETGLWIQYDSLKRKTSEAYYVDGLKQGEYMVFDTLGIVIEKGKYENNLVSEVKYYKDGKGVFPLVNNVYKLIRNKTPWTEEQRKSERTACINKIIFSNPEKAMTYCDCILERFEMYLSFDRYKNASEEEKSQILDVFGSDCK